MFRLVRNFVSQFLFFLLQLTYVSPNEAEVVAMAMGADYNSDDVLNQTNVNNDPHSLIHRLQPYILKLLQRGVIYVVLTLGEHGVVLCSKKQCHIDNEREKMRGDAVQSNNLCYLHFPALQASIVSLSGAGDCFVAGTLTALSLHKRMASSIAFGIAVARQAIQSELNVPSDLLCEEDLQGKYDSLTR